MLNHYMLHQQTINSFTLIIKDGKYFWSFCLVAKKHNCILIALVGEWYVSHSYSSTIRSAKLSLSHWKGPTFFSVNMVWAASVGLTLKEEPKLSPAPSPQIYMYDCNFISNVSA